MTDTSTTDTADTVVTIGRRFYPPHVVTVDGDDGPSAIAVQARRLTTDELADLKIKWHAIENAPSDRAIFREPDTIEQETVDTPVTLANGVTTSIRTYVIPDGEIRRRRLSDMTAEALEAWQRQEQADARAMLTAAAEIVRDGLRVAPAFPDGGRFRLLIDTEDGSMPRPAVTGADLIDLFGGNAETLARLARIVHDENTLSAEKKTRSAPRSASNTGSTPKPSAHGSGPGEAVAPVAPPGSVASVGAGRRRRGK